MTIDKQLIEALLYEEESSELDFKSEQYPFLKADDNKKSELLKDILAFTNAWRRTDAYILIGIREVKGGKNEITGITEPLDDASLQQFVNSKTQQPITFSYRNLSFEDKNIAIIHISLHKRPIYLKKDFGKIKKETVYIRRGSSTTIVKPDEIAKMGTDFQPHFKQPELKISFANPRDRTLKTDRPKITSTELITPKLSDIPDYSRRETNSSRNLILGISQAQITHHENRNYYRELTKFTQVNRLVTPLYIAISNSGSVTANDVRIEMSFPHRNREIIVIDEYNYPKIPVAQYSLLNNGV